MLTPSGPLRGSPRALIRPPIRLAWRAVAAASLVLSALGGLLTRGIRVIMDAYLRRKVLQGDLRATTFDGYLRVVVLEADFREALELGTEVLATQQSPVTQGKREKMPYSVRLNGATLIDSADVFVFDASGQDVTVEYMGAAPVVGISANMLTIPSFDEPDPDSAPFVVLIVAVAHGRTQSIVTVVEAQDEAEMAGVAK